MRASDKATSEHSRDGNPAGEGDPLEPAYGSDVVVAMMRSLGVRYAALNPGASFRYLHDSLIHFGGSHDPEVIECPHEEIAVAMAHGYAVSSGKPMAAIVHDVVGLQHASIAIYHAWQDRVPVIVLGGTGPMDSARRRPKNDWGHTALVQGNLVRDYTKWDDQPASPEAIPKSFIRGYNVATSAPAGPVYICYDVTVQQAELTEPVAIPEIAHYRRATPIQAEDGALEELADRLTSAANPLIATEYAGRSPTVAPVLARLAELIGAPVIGRPGRFNIPSTHPLHLVKGGKDLVAAADVMLAIDVPDLFGFFYTNAQRGPASGPKPAAWLAHLTLGDLGIGGWSQGYQELAPVDLEIRAESATALPRLLALCESRMTAAGHERAGARRAAVGERSTSLRASLRREAEATATNTPIALPNLALQLQRALEPHPWVIAKGMLKDWLWHLLDVERPDQWIGINFGGGLGNGLGYSLGVALDRRDDDVVVVDVQGDGDLLYTPSALWTAAHHRLPLLIVVNNNASYFNSENHARQVAAERNRPREDTGIGTAIDGPVTDFAALARSFDVEAIGPIEDPTDLLPALSRGAEFVRRERRPFLVDVRTTSE
jgi:acetolactate synthase-1/2/3 large subunit